MPILTLKLSANAKLNNASALANDLMALSSQILHKRAEVTSVVFEHVAPERWWLGGELTDAACAQLDIRVTKGTNSELEKSTFVAAAFDLLSAQLGEDGRFDARSYVTVQEVPASDWGYGGKTQQQRKVAL